MPSQPDETPAMDIRNALMLLDVGEDFEYGEDYKAVVARLKSALGKLESRGVPHTETEK